MKLYIMTDMEGVCGVMDHDNWVTPTGRYYDEGRRLLTLEVNAAVEGFMSEGATEIVVGDGHGYGGICQALLDRRTYVETGITDPCPSGLDRSFDAIAWVGQHAKAGTEYAHIPHTGWFNRIDYRINGVSSGEFAELAFVGAYLGVRSVFCSGDEAMAAEARALVAGIEAVAVKRGLTPGSGDEYDCEGYRNRSLASLHMHPERARELIRQGAAAGLRRFSHDRDSFQTQRIAPPYRKEVRYRADGTKPAYAAYAEHPTDLIELLRSPETRL